MNNVAKVGIGLLVVGIGISIVFGVSPMDFLKEPSTELPINPQEFLLRLGGFTSGGLIISGTILSLIGLVSSKNQN